MENQILSFIIPALNEAKNIANTIASIKSAIKTFQYEILVIDNGSTDNTIEIARSSGAVAFKIENVNISELRNCGVKNSSGRLICFIDADVSIAMNWEDELRLFLHSVDNDQPFITGSRCGPELGSNTFIEDNWFRVLNKSNSNYINSGHLITTRQTFDRIGGFKTELKTGEDYDFCKRADALKIPVLENKQLQAFHRGYPKTIWQFFLREAWHGRSDAESFKTFLRSKTAAASLINSVAIICFCLSLVLSQTNIALLILFLVIFMNSVIVIQKFGMMPITQFIKVAFCLEIYLLGRSYSPFYKRKRPAARE